tara:strand:- start:184 stop:432 length:249 start_codon:yes stop_codon:yes gene_type:complete
VDGGVKEEIEEDVELELVVAAEAAVKGRMFTIQQPMDIMDLQQVVMEIEVVEERSIAQVMVDLVDLMVEDVPELEMVQMAVL